MSDIYVKVRSLIFTKIIYEFLIENDFLII